MAKQARALRVLKRKRTPKRVSKRSMRVRRVKAKTIKHPKITSHISSTLPF